MDIKLGPDGALYIADWYDRQINHYRNHEGQIDPSNGRIYRLKARDGGLALSRRPTDLSRLSTRELVKRLGDPNKWTRQTALRLIGDRKDPSVAPELKRLLEDETGQLALEALWALNLVGGLDEATALKTLDHADPYVRLWTARLSCDALAGFAAGGGGARPARRDRAECRGPQPARLLGKAAARARMPCRSCGHCWQRSEDAGDIHLPLLLWWALEAKVATDPEAVLALFQDRAIWDLPIVRATVAERLMRRFAAAGTRQDLTNCARLLALAPGPDHIKRLMAGFEAAYAGRSLAGLPPELADALARYSGQSVTLGLRQGKPEAVAEALRLLADERADRAKQLQILQILGEVRRPACVPVVLRLACQSSDNALRTAALSRPGRLRRPGHRRRGAQGLCQHVRRRAGRRPELARGPPRLGGAIPRGDRGSERSILARSLARSSRGSCCWATRESTLWQPSCSDRSSPRPRPSSTPGSTGWPRRSAPAPEFPSRASRSSTSSVLAAIRCSAKGARSGPTSRPTAATTSRPCS